MLISANLDREDKCQCRKYDTAEFHKRYNPNRHADLPLTNNAHPTLFLHNIRQQAVYSCPIRMHRSLHGRRHPRCRFHHIELRHIHNEAVLFVSKAYCLSYSTYCRVRSSRAVRDSRDKCQLRKFDMLANRTCCNPNHQKDLRQKYIACQNEHHCCTDTHAIRAMLLSSSLWSSL